MVSGVNAPNYNYYPPQARQTLQNDGQFLSTINVGTVQNVPPQVAEQRDNVADGKDDGNIGFRNATWNFLKGAVKFVTSPFTDKDGNFSLWETVKTVAIGAAIYFIPGALPIALAAGLIFGGVGMVNAGINIMTAETDAESEAAWQSLGSSTTEFALSLYGAKQYAKASGNTNATFKDGVKQVFKDSKTNIVNAGKAVMNETPASIANRVSNIRSSVGDYTRSARQSFTDFRAMDAQQKHQFLSSKYHAYKTKFGTEFNERFGEYKDIRIKDLGSKIVSIARDSKDKIHMPSTERQAQILGTYSLTGRSTVKPDFYSQLSASERQYYDSLPEDQKRALVRAYRQVA